MHSWSRLICRRARECTCPRPGIAAPPLASRMRSPSFTCIFVCRTPASSLAHPASVQLHEPIPVRELSEPAQVRATAIERRAVTPQQCSSNASHEKKYAKPTKTSLVPVLRFAKPLPLKGAAEDTGNQRPRFSVSRKRPRRPAFVPFAMPSPPLEAEQSLGKVCQEHGEGAGVLIATPHGVSLCTAASTTAKVHPNEFHDRVLSWVKLGKGLREG